jgi:hypothetical protein
VGVEVADDEVGHDADHNLSGGMAHPFPDASSRL